ILLTGNTMAQAVRERIAEIAVLKTIGFSNQSVLSLVLAEGITLLLIGAAAGLLFAGLVVSVVRLKYGTSVPLNPVGREIWLQGVGLAIAVGLIVGALPAVRGMRLRIVDALSGR
ncbi:MAG: FtsX-like permease family protein, partial [Gammaproteobacteria bacterium]|nr:FtsX-like permease family protein [Gammaproteobacteria bacterium]